MGVLPMLMCYLSLGPSQGGRAWSSTTSAVLYGHNIFSAHSCGPVASGAAWPGCTTCRLCLFTHTHTHTHIDLRDISQTPRVTTLSVCCDSRCLCLCVCVCTHTCVSIHMDWSLRMLRFMCMRVCLRHFLGGLGWTEPFVRDYFSSLFSGGLSWKPASHWSIQPFSEFLICQSPSYPHALHSQTEPTLKMFQRPLTTPRPD